MSISFYCLIIPKILMNFAGTTYLYKDRAITLDSNPQ